MSGEKSGTGRTDFEFAEEGMPPPRVVRADEPRRAPPPRAHEPNALPPQLPKTISAFAYPVRGAGLVMLGVGAVFLTVVGFAARFMPLAWFFVPVLGGGYFGMFFLSVVGRTMDDDDRLPDWPGLDVAEIVKTFLLLLWLGLVSFWPLVLIHFVGDVDAAWYVPMRLVVTLAGFVYFPMAVVANQARGGIMSALPHVVVPGILRSLPRYFGPVSMLIVASIAIEFADALSAQVPIVGGLVSNALGLYALILTARLVGVIYRENRTALGWDEVIY